MNACEKGGITFLLGKNDKGNLLLYLIMYSPATAPLFEIFK